MLDAHAVGARAADADLVAVLQRARVDLLAVDEGAVGGLEVREHELDAAALDPGVHLGDELAVGHDVVAGRASDGHAAAGDLAQRAGVEAVQDLEASREDPELGLARDVGRAAHEDQVGTAPQRDDVQVLSRSRCESRAAFRYVPLADPTSSIQ